MTALVSLLFIATIPIDCKITRFFLTLVCLIFIVTMGKYNFLPVSRSHKTKWVGTYYREPLGEIVVHHDNIYKIEKGPR